MDNLRSCYRKCHQLVRLAERSELGYDPDYGCIVNLRHDGQMVRIVELGMHPPEAFMAAYRVINHRPDTRVLPTGAVARAQTMLRGRDLSDAFSLIFGPSNAREALEVARRELDAEQSVRLTRSYAAGVDDLRTVSNRRLNALRSRLSGEYAYSGAVEQAALAQKIDAIDTEISRRYLSTPDTLTICY